ncbi:MAG: hypothetical protein IJU61_06250, partial [Victivallales bacterium]|nr:hypothetical protein [Victivallales bacterium]
MSLDNLYVVMASVADAFCGPGKATIAHHEQDKHGQKMEGFSGVPAKYLYFMDLHQWLLSTTWHAQDLKLNIYNLLMTLLYRYSSIMQLLL